MYALGMDFDPKGLCKDGLYPKPCKARFSERIWRVSASRQDELYDKGTIRVPLSLDLG